MRKQDRKGSTKDQGDLPNLDKTASHFIYKNNICNTQDEFIRIVFLPDADTAYNLGADRSVPEVGACHLLSAAPSRCLSGSKPRATADFGRTLHHMRLLTAFTSLLFVCPIQP